MVGRPPVISYPSLDIEYKVFVSEDPLPEYVWVDVSPANGIAKGRVRPVDKVFLNYRKKYRELGGVTVIEYAEKALSDNGTKKIAVAVEAINAAWAALHGGPMPNLTETRLGGALRRLRREARF